MVENIFIILSKTPFESNYSPHSDIAYKKEEDALVDYNKAIENCKIPNTRFSLKKFKLNK